MNDIENLINDETRTQNDEGCEEGHSALVQLRLVLDQQARSKKSWSTVLTNQARDLFTEVLVQEDMEIVAEIANEIAVPALEAVVQEWWMSLSHENRDQFITQLIKNQPDKEKAANRQVAIAARIAALDPLSSTRMLSAVVGPLNRKRSWPHLPIYKKEQLQKRFLDSEYDWSNLHLGNLEAAEALLLAFTEAADDPNVSNFKSKGGLYRFTRWAFEAADRVNLKPSARDEVLRRLVRIGDTLPAEWKTEIEQLARSRSSVDDSPVPDSDSISDFSLAVSQNVSTAPSSALTSVASKEAPSIESPPQVSTAGSIATNSSVPDATVVPTAPEQTHSDPPIRAPEELPLEAVINNKEDDIKKTESAIELLQQHLDYARTEVSLMRALNDALQMTLGENKELEARTVELEELVSRLQDSNARLNLSVSQNKKALDDSEAQLGRYKPRVAMLEKELEEEGLQRDVERKEFAVEMERQIQNKLESFKVRLGNKLSPIFKNKRSTDKQPGSDELTKFFRNWFVELERQLKDAGVRLEDD